MLDSNEVKQAKPNIGHPVEQIYSDVKSEDLYQNISSQMNADHPKEHKSITSSMSELAKA